MEERDRQILDELSKLRLEDLLWDAITEVRFIAGNKVTIPKPIVDRLKLKPGDYLKIAIKKIKD